MQAEADKVPAAMLFLYQAKESNRVEVVDPPARLRRRRRIRSWRSVSNMTFDDDTRPGSFGRTTTFDDAHLHTAHGPRRPSATSTHTRRPRRKIGGHSAHRIRSSATNAQPLKLQQHHSPATPTSYPHLRRERTMIKLAAPARISFSRWRAATCAPVTSKKPLRPATLAPSTIWPSSLGRPDGGAASRRSSPPNKNTGAASRRSSDSTPTPSKVPSTLDGRAARARLEQRATWEGWDAMGRKQLRRSGTSFRAQRVAFEPCTCLRRRQRHFALWRRRSSEHRQELTRPRTTWRRQSAAVFEAVQWHITRSPPRSIVRSTSRCRRTELESQSHLASLGRRSRAPVRRRSSRRCAYTIARGARGVESSSTSFNVTARAVMGAGRGTADARGDGVLDSSAQRQPPPSCQRQRGRRR